ncbi:MAG: type VI secretion system-associated protein TagF [Planctomycetes bacterium]|nr:type VI secretion system-associated protein TagF [Planctomycetota bacterium]
MSEFPSGCLGKLPLHGDFIRYNAALAEVRDFDTWIQEGIYQGYQELDSKWDSSFDAAPTARFIYCAPKTKRILAGLFKPSVDKAGRRYPFLVYTVIEPGALGNDAAYLPWAMEPFLLKATELAAWSDSAIDLKTFLSSFESLRFELDLTEARKSFAKYVLSHATGDYWAASYGSPDDDRRYAAVQLTSWASDIRSPESSALRFPAGEPEAEAAFWIELSRRLSGGNQLPTLTYWNEPAAAAVRLNLAFGALRPAYFLPFVLPQHPSREVTDLSAMQHVDASLVDRSRSQFEEVLSDPSLKLSDLLQRLPRAKTGAEPA